MNDPTNCNPDPSIKAIEVENPALAKEMSKRWNAYPGLVEIVQAAIEVAELYPEQEKWSARWRMALQTLGEEVPPQDDILGGPISH